IEKAKNELLARAVEDSKNKAKILAKASDVKLGDIVNIIYSKEEKSFVTAPVRAMALKGDARNDSAYDIDIEPDNIVADDTVTIIWEIN
ncbi:MAG: SIMPL domain-containing protein, partial [Lachnospiraceae bacterium]|nr:SIMPL domain-containing protein [Lachnospiraceae bacterium]